MNRWRQRIGLGIDTSEAHRIKEDRIKFTKDKKDETEREIAVSTTEERVKQMHEVVIKMREEMFSGSMTHF